MQVIHTLKALIVHLQAQKKNDPAWIVDPQPQLLKICLFGKYIRRLGIVNFNLSSNWWISLQTDANYYTTTTDANVCQKDHSWGRAR